MKEPMADSVYVLMSQCLGQNKLYEETEVMRDEAELLERKGDYVGAICAWKQIDTNMLIMNTHKTKTLTAMCDQYLPLEVASL